MRHHGLPRSSARAPRARRPRPRRAARSASPRVEVAALKAAVPHGPRSTLESHRRRRFAEPNESTRGSLLRGCGRSKKIDARRDRSPLRRRPTAAAGCTTAAWKMRLIAYASFYRAAALIGPVRRSGREPGRPPMEHYVNAAPDFRGPRHRAPFTAFPAAILPPIHRMSKQSHEAGWRCAPKAICERSGR